MISVVDKARVLANANQEKRKKVINICVPLSSKLPAPPGQKKLTSQAITIGLLLAGELTVPP